MYVALETGSSSLWRESYCQCFFRIEKHIVNLYGLIIHGLIRTFVWIAGLKYLKLLSEISRVNFINLNAYKFGQPAILASKHCSLLTGSRGVSVKRGPDTCGWWMRMGKCGKTPKKVKRTKRRKRMAEMNKQTKERNLSFKSLSRVWALHVQYALSIVGTGYSGFFLNSLNPVIPFINVTETRTLRSSSLKPRMLWCTSPLSTQPGYSVRNLQKRKYFQGQQFENDEFFQCLETKNCSIKKQKGGT